MNETSLTHQLGLAVAIVQILELLKRWPAFRWMSVDTATVNRVVAVGAAIASTIGLQIAFTGSFLQGGDIAIHFPPLATMADVGLKALVQYGAQQVVYRTTMDPKTPLVDAPKSSE